MNYQSDSYLEIAQHVLASSRRPMSTHEIMRYAYLLDLVPIHLHGQTQHKTLGARLSEDILKLRQKSRFFRTRPGRFFLRNLIRDRSLPIDYRTPIVAKRRRRELKKHNIAYIDGGSFAQPNLFGGLEVLTRGDLEIMVTNNQIRYGDITDIPRLNGYPLYSYVVVCKSTKVLVHRRGHYIESRRAFTHRKSIGFSIPVCHDDLTLFDVDDHGIVSAGLTALAIDLDFEFGRDLPLFEESAELATCAVVPDRAGVKSLLGLVRVEAPEEFQPTDRRLSISDLHWIDIAKRSSYRTTEFDPWSRYLLREFQSALVR